MNKNLGFCPFCGSSDLDVARDMDIERDPESGLAVGKDFFYVMCTRCEAAGPTSYDRDEAIAKWKRRATEVDDEPRNLRGDYDE